MYKKDIPTKPLYSVSLKSRVLTPSSISFSFKMYDILGMRGYSIIQDITAGNTPVCKKESITGQIFVINRKTA